MIIYKANQNRITLLLGAGISIPANLPSTHDITEQVLSGEGLMRHTDGNYYFGKPLYAHLGWPDESVPKVVEFLRRIKVELDSYYSEEIGHEVTYEDLYYAVAQIHDSELREYDNPIVQPFIDKILPDIKSLLVSSRPALKNEWKLHELTSETCNYILDIVWWLLSKQPNSLDYLSCIKDACKNNDYGCTDIFTLNHDTILEHFLKSKGIEFTDGFGEPINNIRYWHPDLFESNSSQTRLIKLHGSLNWFRLTKWIDNKGYVSIGIPLGGDLRQLKGPNGELTTAIDHRPLILAGTFNKMLKYTSGIYADLHFQFYQTLRYSKELIICGFGFRDKAINTSIIEWVYASPVRRLIIIHPDPSALKKTARPAIAHNLRTWKDSGRLIFIKKSIQDTTWDDINGSLRKRA